MISYQEDVLIAFERLVGGNFGAVKLRSLDIKQSKGNFVGWQIIEIPEWAFDIIPKKYKGLLVPKWSDANNVNWDQYDWWRGAYFMIKSQWERLYEDQNGPTHSYSYKYNSETQRLFDYAWANRIILFLRRWWAIKNETNEKFAFCSIPKPIIHLTHDVDAISKTLPIRLKQAAFWAYKLSFVRAMNFFFSPANYWQFQTIMQLENSFGYRSKWNIYGGDGGWLRAPKKILFDPSYSVFAEPVRKQLCLMLEHGHQIGLHQSFDAWQEPDIMRIEKRNIEEVIHQEIDTCRQHWLRFSFKKTWKAQAEAGLRTDMTLGFNDRPGFRNSAAIKFTDKASGIEVIPMVLMDSHLYDYSTLNNKQQYETIDNILEELKNTGGEASIIWHHRVFHSDYGWDGGYKYLLKKINEMEFETL